MTDLAVEEEMRERLSVFLELADACFLSRRDAARIVGVSTQTIQNWTTGQHLPRGYAEMKRLERGIEVLREVPEEDRVKLKPRAARQVWLTRVTA